MIISAAEITVPTAESASVTDDTLSVELNDGRTISVPLGWFPRLAHATRTERRQWRLIGRGHGIHWPLIDEDVSIAGLLAGRPSGESQESFKRWLAARTARVAKGVKKSASGTARVARRDAETRKIHR